MNIIVHYPKCAQDVAALQKVAAKIHADAAVRYIQKLTCPKAQKMELYKELKTACREKR